MPSTSTKRPKVSRQKHATAVQLVAPKPDRRAWLIAACLAVGIIALYWCVLGNRFVNFDDGVYVYQNDHVKSGLTLAGLRWAFSDFSSGNWHPLTWISHMLDVQFFGLNPSAHHFVSVLWHALNAAILLIALWRMTGCLWRSAFVAALFALHPLRVESVAWAAERKDVLSSFFYLSTIWAYAWYTLRPQSWRRYAAVAGLLSLGLMAKPSVVTAPFLLLLLDYWPLRRKEPWSLLIREKIPLFALAAALSVVTYLGQKQVGAMTAIENLGLPERLGNAVVSYVRYLGKIFWPHPLAVLYPYQRDLPVLIVAASFLLLAAITGVALYFGRSRRYLPAGWFWFLGTMAPMIGIVQVGWQAYADRYSYMPSIGIFIAVVWVAADAFEARKWRLAAPVAAAVVLPALALVTWSQIAYWHDDTTLFRHAIAVTAANPAAEYHLGDNLVEAGSNAEAIPHLEAMTRLQPHFYAAWYTLGKARAAQGEAKGAIEDFTGALKLKPDYGDAYYARAATLVKTGSDQAAESDYRNALKYGVSVEYSAESHNALGVILAQRGDMKRATEEFEQAVQLRPDMVGAQNNLAHALLAQGRTAEAIARLNQALAATHGDPVIAKALAELRGR